MEEPPAAAKPAPAQASTIATAVGGAAIMATCVVVVFLPYLAVPGVPLGFGLTRSAFERSAIVGAVVFVLMGVFEIVVAVRHTVALTVSGVARQVLDATSFHLSVAFAFGLMSWPATYAWCAVENSRSLGPPVSFVCTVQHCGTKRCSIDCRDPRGRLHEDDQHRDRWIPEVGQSFRGFARIGALGVWVLDTGSVRVLPGGRGAHE